MLVMGLGGLGSIPDFCNTLRETICIELSCNSFNVCVLGCTGASHQNIVRIL